MPFAVGEVVKIADSPRTRRLMVDGVFVFAGRPAEIARVGAGADGAPLYDVVYIDKENFRHAIAGLGERDLTR